MSEELTPKTPEERAIDEIGHQHTPFSDTSSWLDYTDPVVDDYVRQSHKEAKREFTKFMWQVRYEKAKRILSRLLGRHHEKEDQRSGPGEAKSGRR